MHHDAPHWEHELLGILDRLDRCEQTFQATASTEGLSAAIEQHGEQVLAATADAYFARYLLQQRAQLAASDPSSDQGDLEQAAAAEAVAEAQRWVSEMAYRPPSSHLDAAAQQATLQAAVRWQEWLSRWGW